MRIEPDKELVKNHEVPKWFHDAKFGIFIHWGLYSVPAFSVSDLDLIESSKQGPEYLYKHNPYSSWYLNSLRIEGSPTQNYHLETHGNDFDYDDFAPIFNEEIKKWNPTEMADLFKKAGAKYAVLTSKHHEGFLLWPSDYPNPKKENYQASRDIVGELSEAVRNKGLKMGLYYSGSFDWSFKIDPIKDGRSFVENGNDALEYIKYANNHWYELIDKYEPIILWNDIGYPPNTNLYELFTYYYQKIPDGLVNDRWLQRKKKGLKYPRCRYNDFLTPEYETFGKITAGKWEASRGIGNTYGYNKNEKPENFLTGTEAIHLLIDIVSKNGNLLLNVGPRPDGTIQDEQKNCLLAIGEWLEINGKAIFGTRPWIKAEGKTMDGITVRYTKKDNSLYVLVLSDANSETHEIVNLTINKDALIRLLGCEENIKWEQKNNNIVIQIPKNLSLIHALSFEITPLP